jgi:hypothetical protein
MSRADRFTWHKDDVEWEFVPDPNAKPIMTPQQLEQARQWLRETEDRERQKENPMAAKLYEVDLPPEILSRGFWLYTWKIVGPEDERFCYVGMTGDVTGVAQSPYVRAGAHLGFNKNSNALRRLLVKQGVEPETCKSMTFLAYGPVLSYSHQHPKHPDYEASRKRVGALERKLWTAVDAAQNKMLNERPRFAEEFDKSLWEDVRTTFALHLTLSN